MYGVNVQPDRSTCLAQVEQLRIESTRCTNLDDLKRLRDRCERLRAETVQHELGLELHNEAAEIKLLVERRLGNHLSELKLRGGDRRSERQGQVRLKDLGIDKNQSARWQQEASVPDDVFADYLSQARAEGQEISSAALLRLAKKLRKETCRSMDPYRSQGAEPLTIHDLPERRLGLTGVLGVSEHVSEGKNHVRTLRTLLEYLCERAELPPEAGESRACRRYLEEITEQFDCVLGEFTRLTYPHVATS